MKTYWVIYRLQIFVNISLFMSLAYVGVTFTNKLFNGTHFRVITGTGLCAHIAQMWMKRMKLAEMQEKIEPAYSK